MLKSRPKPKPKPKLPDGIRIYAVSDIHGRADLLQDVFAAIDHHLARSEPVRALQCSWGTISIVGRRRGRPSIC